MGTVGGGGARGTDEVLMETPTQQRRDDWKIAVDALRIEVSSLRIEVSALVLQNVEIKELQDSLREMDKILVRGNGKPSLMEDVRNLLAFVRSLRFWLTALAIAFIGQFAAVTITMIIAVVRLIPVK